MSWGTAPRRLQSLASWCPRHSARVVEDDAERVARAGAYAADTVAHGDPVIPASTSRRAMARGEDHDLALRGGDRLAAGLGARALLDEQELAALVIRPYAAQEARELQRERHLAVQVLVQAVVAPGLVVKQQRRGLRLAGAPALGLEPCEVGGVAAPRAESLLPPVGHGGQRRVE